MRKLISLTLILIMVLSMFAVGVSADSGELTRKEAIELIRGAINSVYLGKYGYFYNFEGPETAMFEKPTRREFLNVLDPIIPISEVYFEASSSGLLYTRPRMYYKVKPKEGYEYLSTPQKMKEYVSQFFDDKGTDRALCHQSGYPYKDMPESFRLSTDSCLLQSQLVMEPTSLARNTITGYGALSSNSSRAKMIVPVFHTTNVNNDGGYIGDYYDETVEFTKTAAGWRISGGTAIKALYDYNAVGTNPDTGDSDAVVVPVLAVVAIIAIALPVVITKRRRRA